MEIDFDHVARSALRMGSDASCESSGGEGAHNAVTLDRRHLLERVDGLLGAVTEEPVWLAEPVPE